MDSFLETYVLLGGFGLIVLGSRKTNMPPNPGTGSEASVVSEALRLLLERERESAQR